MIQPSCPVFVVHDDDAFRKSLIAALDAAHFSVTFAPDGEEAVAVLEQRAFKVALIGFDPKSAKGLRALQYLSDHREERRCGVIIIGEANPEVRTYAKLADETLIKPVDAAYVAERARTYCGC